MLLNQMSNLKQRLMISFCAIILVFSSVYYSHEPFFSPMFLLLTGLVICFAQIEYYDIAIEKKFLPLKKLGLLFTFIYLIISYLSIFYLKIEFLPLIVIWFFLLVIFGYYLKFGSHPFTNLAITFFGFAYLTIPLSLILYINYSTNAIDGRYLLFYLLFISKITDTGAYFIGKKYGAKKLAPIISPKKSWEGAIGGFICALIASILFVKFYSNGEKFLNFSQSIWIGAIISLLSQFGDLSESLLKRDAGIKDSSHLPGMGGVLDIVDSLIFPVPFIYFLLKLGVIA